MCLSVFGRISRNGRVSNNSVSSLLSLKATIKRRCWVDGLKTHIISRPHLFFRDTTFDFHTTLLYRSVMIILWTQLENDRHLLDRDDPSFNQLSGYWDHYLCKCYVLHDVLDISDIFCVPKRVTLLMIAHDRGFFCLKSETLPNNPAINQSIAVQISVAFGTQRNVTTCRRSRSSAITGFSEKCITVRVARHSGGSSSSEGCLLSHRAERREIAQSWDHIDQWPDIEGQNQSEKEIV